MRRGAAIGILLGCVSCGRIDFEALGDASGIGGDGRDGPQVAVPHCELLTACGPMQNASCCDSKVVTGGMFLRGHDVAADNMFPDTTSPATVSTFWLDTYEVTVGRFRQFVEAGLGTQMVPPAADAGAHDNIPNSGWRSSWNTELAADTAALRAALACNPSYFTWTDIPGSNENRPITCVSWYDAMAFCGWDGGFLPTEAEWNYAAVGGTEYRAYPWSMPAATTTITCTEANYGGTNWPTTACVAAGQDVVGSTSPVGDGAFGQADLAGNAWEWGLDWYAPAAPSPCDDCANVDPPLTTRVVRGGSFNDVASMQRAARRGNGTEPYIRFRDVGFRCARAP